jgi:glucose/arabinose dehydrogenase
MKGGKTRFKERYMFDIHFPVFFPRRPIPSLAALATLAFTTASAPAQVALRNAFPDVKFSRPVYVGEMPGAPSQTYVVLEQHLGLASTVTRKNGAWVKGTLLHLDVHQAGEMGLLGIAFHPDYKNNHKYYVYYNPPGDMKDVLEEREADAGLMQDAGKARRLIEIPDKYDNHNAGTLAFGPRDGFLYLSLGDGGAAYDPDGNGQNTKVLLGKLLRIDVDRKDPGLEYGIPADNPFAGAGSAPGAGRGEIWAYGLRNPWKWSFDRLTGELWLGDVGQNEIEEVDIIAKGGNYGWDPMEGPSGKNSGNMILPIYSYPHSAGTCVIGGYVYRGDPASKYYGTYFFTDETKHNLWTLKKGGDGQYAFAEVGTGPGQFTSMGTDSQGRLYVCGLTTQTVYLLDSPDLGPGPVPTAIGLQAGPPATPQDRAAQAWRARIRGLVFGYEVDGRSP